MGGWCAFLRTGVRRFPATTSIIRAAGMPRRPSPSSSPRFAIGGSGSLFWTAPGEQHAQQSSDAGNAHEPDERPACTASEGAGYGRPDHAAAIPDGAEQCPYTAGSLAEIRKRARDAIAGHKTFHGDVKAERCTNAE